MASDNGGVREKVQDDAQAQEKGQDSKQPQSDGPRGVSNFDWVTKRSSCSLPKVFSALRSQIEQDVKTRNALRPENSPYEFSVTQDNDKLVVGLDSKGLQRSVTFSLSLAERAILVSKEDGKRMFEIAIKFDDCGECQLIVNDTELEFWQVRRIALEELMFSGF